jgi:hypothetical protein
MSERTRIPALLTSVGPGYVLEEAFLNIGPADKGAVEMSPRLWMIARLRRDDENFNSESGPLTYWVASGCAISFGGTGLAINGWREV